MIKVDPKRCPQNHRCPLISMCPKKAIIQEGYGLPSIDHSKCIECGICTTRCPTRAMMKS